MTSLLEEFRQEDVFNYDKAMDAAIKDLDDRGVCLMDFSKEIRHKSFVLEKRLTKPANENRREDFLKYLDGWQACFT